MSNSRLKIWLSAFRLRTLPLALSCVFMGTALAFSLGKFNIFIFIATIVTTILLQILSNLANDYGDGVKGTDNENRIGPQRAVQSGSISLRGMKTAIVINVLLCLLSGCFLLFLSFGASHFLLALFFLLLGVASIAAAIKYTVGSNAYGYSGFGDLAVFIFFGLVGVMGTHFLFALHLDWLDILPAICIGLCSVGVLNLNNMRDIENDKASQKNTIPVVLGLINAKRYHLLVLTIALSSILVYSLLTYQSLMQLLYFLVLPLFVKHLIEVKKCLSNKDFNPMLPKLAIATFLLSLLFFIGEMLSKH